MGYKFVLRYIYHTAIRNLKEKKYNLNQSWTYKWSPKCVGCRKSLEFENNNKETPHKANTMASSSSSHITCPVELGSFTLTLWRGLKLKKEKGKTTSIKTQSEKQHVSVWSITQDQDSEWLGSHSRHGRVYKMCLYIIRFGTNIDSDGQL